MRDLLDQGLVLGTQLVTLETGKGTQTHIYDGTCLQEREVEARHQLLDRLLGLARSADDADDLVDIVYGDDQPLKDVDALLGLTQVVLRAAVDDVVAVLDEVMDQVAQVQ